SGAKLQQFLGMTKGFVKFVWADAVSVPSAFNFVEGFAVLWLTPFLASLFEWLKPFLCLRRLNGFAVSMCFARLACAELKVNFVEGCAVLWLTPFLASPFEWASPVSRFEWLRRLNG
ncbi:MAG: hypothetical protein II575_00420, partial [Bacteroidales bacterium]|nr:hypothetical protein [Bacteroidales bacterium]